MDDKKPPRAKRFSFKHGPRRVLTDRAAGSLAVMKLLWLTGVDLPPEPKEYRGSGVPLQWD